MRGPRRLRCRKVTSYRGEESDQSRYGPCVGVCGRARALARGARSFYRVTSARLFSLQMGRYQKAECACRSATHAAAGETAASASAEAECHREQGK